MKKIISIGLLSAAMLSPLAHAAKAELKLIGTITPAACVPNFTGGATIDYGNIPAGSLNASTPTKLPAKLTKLNVTCDSPTTFYLSTADERAATAITSLETIPGYSASQKFGLGAAAGGENIGAYSLQIQNETSDTGATQRLLSTNSGSTWAAFGGGLRADGSSIIGFGDGTSTAPTAHTSVDMDLNVVATLDNASNLPLENDITIDGLATIEVIYP